MERENHMKMEQKFWVESKVVDVLKNNAFSSPIFLFFFFKFH